MVNQAKKRALVASALVSAMASAFAQDAANSQAPGQDEAANLAKVVVLGSRTQAKTALDTAVPVGLISAQDLQSAGSLELGKVLQDLDPSFNFTTTFISDGTDIIRPATLRGWSTYSRPSAAARPAPTSMRFRCLRSRRSKCCAMAPPRNTARTRLPV
jgi:iron complex outermembrane recepter protein